MLYIIATVVTFYATLGEDAVAFGLNECGVTHLVTSMELLETKLKVNYSLLSLIIVSCTETSHTQLFFMNKISSGFCLDVMLTPFYSIFYSKTHYMMLYYYCAGCPSSNPQPEAHRLRGQQEPQHCRLSREHSDSQHAVCKGARSKA